MAIHDLTTETDKLFREHYCHGVTPFPTEIIGMQMKNRRQ
jgi:hypothetical protein